MIYIFISNTQSHRLLAHLWPRTVYHVLLLYYLSLFVEVKVKAELVDHLV